MLQRLYHATMRLAAHRHALWWLAALAFVEASFFPIPVEALLLPVMFANPRRAWLAAAVATAGTVAGGVAGYAVGALLYEFAGRPILAFYGYQEAYGEFARLYDAWGAWIVFAGGFTPIPYKVVTIASGAAGLDMMVFVLASAVSRGLRFGIQAVLLACFGPPVRAFIEKRLGLAVTVAFAALVAGFAALSWLL